ncbi:TIGR04219 family outer membrane beta-barrel protein [Ferrimonas balearica]|uniref:TIGR04219 family outer membrane beta-barrel protein n=1 Tax=Ferrimonas balearica TaxID=44012 RepID=UPI001C584AD9|nr:TIGR04219 family outer membrane beta-barrel protein [Ferrimonas balearica]MBW3164549.1 TIGR04219 family outer membrane beta-barrel protein [Ferrimonas balearica]
MKLKPSMLAVALAAVCAVPAQADVLGVKAGMDLYFVSTNGELQGDEAAWKDKNRISAYAAFEHFIPIVPNLMVRYNAMGTVGDGGASSGADLDLTNTDFIFYYELLDNPGIELDLGVNYRLYSGEASRDGSWDSQDIDKGVFMGYARSRFNLVGTGLFAFADVALTNYSDRKISDYQLGLGYGLGLFALDLNLRGGYRQHDFDVKNFNGITADVSQDGWFLGAELAF